jgi:putative hydrolase of the HAD superfamily
MTAPTSVVLSDLDDTLFDHTRATRTALGVVRTAIPGLEAWSHDELHARHADLLERLHLDVVAGRLAIDDARIERFRRLLADAGAEAASDRAPDVARRYRREYELASQPVAGALELMTQLKRAGAVIVIVTNNVVAEQRLKLARCGLAGLVDELVTSEEVGVSKPDARIFLEALTRARAQPADAVMLGDGWATDIEGALSAGVRPVWLNRFGRPRPIASVQEITSFEPVERAVGALLHGR